MQRENQCTIYIKMNGTADVITQNSSCDISSIVDKLNMFSSGKASNIRFDVNNESKFYISMCRHNLVNHALNAHQIVICHQTKHTSRYDFENSFVSYNSV